MDAASVAADDDGVIDVSVTSLNHGDYDDDVREQWRHSSRHHDRSTMTTVRQSLPDFSNFLIIMVVIVIINK